MDPKAARKEPLKARVGPTLRAVAMEELMEARTKSLVQTLTLNDKFRHVQTCLNTKEINEELHRFAEI